MYHRKCIQSEASGAHASRAILLEQTRKMLEQTRKMTLQCTPLPPTFSLQDNPSQ